MSYNSIVLVREVWDTRDLVGDVLDSSGKVKEETLATRFEVEDLNALEMALKIKDEHGGKVTAVSLGKDRETDVLRECLYRNVDEGIRLADPKFDNLDTFGCSYVISKAIEKIGDFDMVFAGIDVVEGENAQIGSHVAQQLGIEQVSYVDELEEISPEYVVCKRAIEGGYETVQANLPALVIVGVALLKDDPRAPRSAKARLKLRRKKTKIPVWDAPELALDDSLLSSLTTIEEYETVPTREIESKNVDPKDEDELEAMLDEVMHA